MTDLLYLIEGSFGAMIMVGAGMMGIVALPLALIMCLVPPLTGDERDGSYYLICISIPILCWGVAFSVFVMRALVALYFVP